MSLKTLLFLAIIGAGAYALTRATPPLPPKATAADSARVATASLGMRFHYGVGHLGSKIVGGSVRGMVDETQTTLNDMRSAIRGAKGPDGARAQQYAKKIMQMDSVVMNDLAYGRPIDAVKGALEAKSLLNAVRQQIQRNI